MPYQPQNGAREALTKHSSLIHPIEYGRKLKCAKFLWGDRVARVSKIIDHQIGYVKRLRGRHQLEMNPRLLKTIEYGLTSTQGTKYAQMTRRNA